MRFPSLALLLAAALPSWGAPPRAVDPELMLELVAQEPEVRTPTAIQVDEQGRTWVLENNTHFRPKNYDAPATDRVLVIQDYDASGRATRITVFADGFRDGMGLLLTADGVIVSTRSEVFRLRDRDGDGRGEERTTLLKLATTANYPHNGLSGITLDPQGRLFIGLGENFGAPWKLTGSDGSAVTGADEGGVFRCEVDGSKVQRWALGLWNPYGLAADAEGRLFALDNDPSGGSLCRLVQIVRGGDYGFRYRYGRTTDHPFLSWYGDQPGTLPSIALVGEAPTGLMVYGHAPSRGGQRALPARYRGELFGATWSDHGIQHYPLEAHGASWRSKPKWLVQGDRDFRPSGLAMAPDGSVLIADWVDGAYEVHGKGRVWRLRRKAESPETAAPASSARPLRDEEKRMAELLDPTANAVASPAELSSSDPFLAHAAIHRLAQTMNTETLKTQGRSGRERERLNALLVARLQAPKVEHELLPMWLGDESGVIRRQAMKWIAEEQLSALQPELDRALVGPALPRATLEAYFAAHQMLAKGKPDRNATVDHAIRIALDEARPAELRAAALRVLPVVLPQFPAATAGRLARSEHPALRVEAIRILAGRSESGAQEELRQLVGDGSLDPLSLAEAIAGLARSATEPRTQALLASALQHTEPTVVREAQRARGPILPNAEGSALRAAEDPEAGRRLFFHQNGPQCGVCHTVEGRGGEVGPDLTHIGRMSEQQIIEAIANPSAEIAPAYAQWHLKLKDGREAFGVDLYEDSKSALTLIDAAGNKTKHRYDAILSKEVLPVSIMPPLAHAIAAEDLRNLIAYLRQKRN